MNEAERVNIRQADDSDHDLEGMVRVANLARPEFSISVEFMRYLDSIIDSKIKQKRWVAEVDGKIVGYTSYTQDAALYHPHKFRTMTMVVPGYEAQGIGQKLYTTMLEDLKQHDPLEILLLIGENHQRGVAFAEAQGFVEFNRRWVSRLDLTTFDAEPFLPRLKKVEESGIVIRSYADLKDDPSHNRTLDENFYQLHASLTQDIPMPIAQVDDSMAQFRRDILDNPGFRQDLTLIALDGDEFVGLTEIIELENDTVLIWRDGTAKPHRRRGIATAIKVKSIILAKEHGFKFMETENDLVNEAILALNDEFGFVRDVAELWMVLKINEER